MKLRAALNDNAENPVFIETVPRTEYCFIAPALARAEELAGVHLDAAQAGKMFPFEWLPM